MSDKKYESSSRGIGIIGLLGVVFVTLKLTGYIDWSWWWVTLPFWGGFALFISVAIMIFIVYFIAHYYQNRTRR